MRFAVLFLIFLLLPALYLVTLDAQKDWVTGTPFTLSNLGQVWVAHAPDSFETYKNSFRDPSLSLRQQEDNWDTKARVYLELKALPFTLVLPGLYLFWLFLCLLLGFGPFRRLRDDAGEPRKAASPYASLSRRDDGSNRIRYRRH